MRSDTDKAKEHSYGDAYDILFSDFDRQAKLNILEIGVQKGASLLAWKEYFPNATVTGIDIQDDRVYKSDDVKFIVSDIKEWRTDETFDIIIDDGSHLKPEVLFAVIYFRHKLRKNGILVIEDVQDVGWVKEVRSLLANCKFGVIDLREKAGRHDDFLMIIKNA